MTWFRIATSRLKGAVHKSKLAGELKEELRAHVEMLTEENMKRGMTPEEARRQAMLSLGNTTRIQEIYRDQAGLPFFEVLLQDLRYGMRMLRKSSGITAIAIATLALGIGINSAMFSIVNGVLLKPLPYKNPDRLMFTFSSSPARGFSNYGTSPPDFRVLREKNHTFESLSGFYNSPFNLTGEARPELVQGAVVSSEYFKTLGVDPALGRNFLPLEEQWGSHRVVILSDGFWRNHLNGDPDAVGKTLTLNGKQYNILGVMPASFYTQNAAQLWVPMSFAPKDVVDSHENYFLNMIGRLKPDVTQQQAYADLNAIMLGIAQQFPENKDIGADLLPLHERWVGNVRPALLVLFGAVGFVLLIACVNLANLLLARAAGRQREIAIRSALGAARRRLLRQFLTESTLLGLIGGALGLGLAWLSLRLLPLTGNLLPRVQQIQLDLRVLGFTFAISVLTGLFFGLLPAMQSARVRLNDVLKQGGRTSEAGVRSNQTRAVLVIGEIALALLLLIGAGLAIRSFERLMQVNAGFDAHNVLTFTVNLSDTYIGTPDPLRNGAPPRMAEFVQQFLARIQNLPGVESVGMTSGLPLQGENWQKFFVSLDRPAPASVAKVDHTQFLSVGGDYAKAMGIRLVKGRWFDQRDQENSPPVVVVNEALVRHYWPNQDPIGKLVLLSPPQNLIPPDSVPPGFQVPKLTVVGVVEDAHYSTLDQTPSPAVYGSFLQTDWPQRMVITVRGKSDPTPMVGAIRDQLAQMDNNLPIARVLTMEEIIGTSVTQPRLQSILLGLFGFLAMVLAAVGIYGVMSYSVSQRTSEIGIRMALGAKRADVLMMVIRQGLELAALGLLIGLGLSFALTRVMRGILFGISATDPATFVSIALLLALVALLACYIPALRATKVDPMAALRYE